jgi:hypothetical protein
MIAKARVVHLDRRIGLQLPKLPRSIGAFNGTFGFSKDLDHHLTQVIAIEKHLGFYKGV